MSTAPTSADIGCDRCHRPVHQGPHCDTCAAILAPNRPHELADTTPETYETDYDATDHVCPCQLPGTDNYCKQHDDAPKYLPPFNAADPHRPISAAGHAADWS